MFAWFGAHKILTTFILLGVVAALGTGVYFKGVQDGINKQTAAQAELEREAVVEGRTVEREIMRLPKNEVQKRLEEKWCRDCV